MITITGDKICTLEEFLPGENTYEYDGEVISTVVGIPLKDFSTRKVHVKPFNEIPIIKEGDKVVGKIVDVKYPAIALVKIIKILNKKRFVASIPYGVLYVGNIKNEAIIDIRKEIAYGDIIIAKVIYAGKVPVQLATNEEDLGVIYAYCYNCNLPLKHHEENKLICENCGRIELRKISKYYGRGDII